MTLLPGARLGVYSVVAKLGAGGMGEVYRAHDSRLNREVAVKVLPADVSSDSDRVRRFEGEARAAAALNHPNLLAVFDVGQVDGTPFIVSELLVGQTLRERLSEGPLPVRQACAFAVQIAQGLTAAHEKGITHRDLKPENLFLTSDGRVKILDFGLAKLVEHTVAASGVTSAPTTPPVTEPGMVLGTAGYMAPEQVRGQPVDGRTDLFAFGAVLYEMLTGRRAFAGATAMDTLTAILREDPPDPPEDLAVSPGLMRIVRRCLEKPVAARFQTASDLAFALESAAAPSSASAQVPGYGGTAVASPRPTSRRLVPWGIAAVAMVAAAFLAWRPTDAVQAGAGPRVHFTVPLGDAIDNGLTITPVPSPDGRKLAFFASMRAGAGIHVRAMSSPEVRLLAPSERPRPGGAIFWSPDSRYVAFFTDGGLKKVDAEQPGTSAETIWEGQTGPGATGAWGPDGTILMAPSISSVIVKIGTAGGPAAPVTVLDASRGELAHRVSGFLPDGRHFLFMSLPSRTTFVGSVDASERTQVVVADSQVMYSAGHLLFVREGDLLAQGFDPSTFALTGEPFRLASGLNPSATGPSSFGASAAGVLAYSTATRRRSRFAWFNRDGTGRTFVGEAGWWYSFELSRDARMVAAQRIDERSNTSDLWLLDTSRGLSTRLTTDAGVESDPLWSPDGSSLVFSAARLGESPNLYRIDVSGGPASPLLQSPEDEYATSWSADGRHLLYVAATGGFGAQKTTINALTLSDPAAPTVWHGDAFDNDEARFSPDGRWVAYGSTESGRWEIYVRPFSDGGAKVRVSPDGGAQPIWRADGRELFYLAPDGRMFGVPVNGTGASFESGTPSMLFETPIPSVVPERTQYSVTGDGRRFLFSVPEGETSPTALTVVLNWAASLRGR